jgi:quercetin dioxygenase-like cupin family protein
VQIVQLSQSLSEKAGAAWQEVMRVPSLSVGVYRLQAGQADSQKPHSEDEVYYVLRGKAKFGAGDQQRDVAAGSLIFVERHIEHRFFDVTEELVLLVFFAPAEGTGAKGSAPGA